MSPLIGRMDDAREELNKTLRDKGVTRNRWIIGICVTLLVGVLAAAVKLIVTSPTQSPAASPNASSG
jgi:hypothetical protein